MSKISNFLNEQFPITSQNKRLFCAYHNSQFLTNFCLQKQCLMPLCPSCIVQHTQQHFQQGKKPIYSNLNQALNKSKQDCYYNIIVLSEYKKANQQIFEYITTLQDNIHYQLQKKKQNLFQIISQIFRQYQTRLIEQITQNYKQKNVYDKTEALNANKYIQEEINNLYQKISLLKGDQCLTALITYHAVDQQSYNQALQQFDQYFQKNRKAGKIEVSIIQDNLKKIFTNLCDNMLSIQSIIENFQKKSENQDQNQLNSMKSKRYGFNKPLQISHVGKISRRILTDKQNQQSNFNRKQQFGTTNPHFQNNQKQTGKIVYHSTDKDGQRINKQVSLNAHNYPSMRKDQPQIKSVNEFSRQQNQINRNQQSTDSVQIQSYGSKRFTREFKKQL